MSEIAEIIDTLENRIVKLFGKIDALEENIKILNQELTQNAIIVQKKTDEFEVLKTQYESLKITNSLLGSDENKRDTKLKINSLIREIDYCIAQLSD
jgi:CTP:phosphocholine cytidylyltransferase-like protein